jgi:hypothetical protein
MTDSPRPLTIEEENRMKTVRIRTIVLVACAFLAAVSCRLKNGRSASLPFLLDHNRMLVDAELLRNDGTWRKARLWVDTGNPDFFVSPALARDLGFDLPTDGGNAEAPPPAGVRIGDMPLDFNGVKCKVLSEPSWLFSTMHNDANLPSTVLKKYQVVFDYPKKRITLAEPGSLGHRGRQVPAGVNESTGIVQIDAVAGGDTLSLALDNGASYSFVSRAVLERFRSRNPPPAFMTGAIGCANIWGWWPDEPSWPVVRMPLLRCGDVSMSGVGIAGLPDFFPGGSSLGDWYSLKTARPVAGFLGPNAFKAFRMEIDYANRAVYFEKGAEFDLHDMDLAGLTLRPEADGGYRVIGIAVKDGVPSVMGVKPGDRLVSVGKLETAGATMGEVVDALRGEPGSSRTLTFRRDGRSFTVAAKVERFL